MSSRRRALSPETSDADTEGMAESGTSLVDLKETKVNQIQAQLKLLRRSQLPILRICRRRILSLILTEISAPLSDSLAWEAMVDGIQKASSGA